MARQAAMPDRYSGSSLKRWVEESEYNEKEGLIQMRQRNPTALRTRSRTLVDSARALSAPSAMTWLT